MHLELPTLESGSLGSNTKELLEHDGEGISLTTSGNQTVIVTVSVLLDVRVVCQYDRK